MAISYKIGIGAVLVALGIAGMVYSTPIVARSVALDRNDPRIFDKSAIPSLPSSAMQYVGMEIVSTVSFTVGIVVMALGQTETYKPQGASPESRVDLTRTSKDTEAA